MPRDIRREMDELKREMKRLARQARKHAASRGATRHVNVGGRTNVVVSDNVGRDGSVHTAYAAQVSPIRQGGPADGSSTS